MAPHRPLLVAFLALLAGRGAQAQSNWVDWTDDTSSRLQLSVVAASDGDEKDIAAADLDNDGDADVVVVRKVPFSTPGGRIDVLLMNEDGVLVDRTPTLIPGFLTADDSRDVLIFDSNADGWPDIVTVNTFGGQPRLFVGQGVDGSGAFLGWIEDTGWFTPLFSPGPKFCGVASGDVTGDGMPDLFFVDYSSPLEDKLLVNDGTGHFVDETSARMTPTMAESGFGTGAFIEDMNLDGWADIVKLSTLVDPVVLRMLINGGSGFFTGLQDLPFDAAYMIDAADYDSDGRMDLYVVSDNQDYLIYNDSTHPAGTIGFSVVNVTSSARTAIFGGNAHAADLDKDGYPDEGVADVDVDIPGCGRRFGALRGAPSRGMSDPNNPLLSPWNSGGTYDFAWIDVDGDRFLDLFLGTCDGYRVFRMEPFASTEIYGDGCPGTGGIPSISSDSAPSPGNPAFTIGLGGAIPGAIPFLVLGLGRSALDLGGCDLLVGLPLVGLFAAATTDGSGSTVVPLPIPPLPSLEGVRVFAQWLVPDPGGALLAGGQGWSASEGLEIYVSANALP